MQGEEAPQSRGGHARGPQERLLTGLLLLFSLFATGLPRVFTSTAAHAVLIDRYGADAVPWAYVLEALLVPLAGAGFVRLEGRLPLRTLVLGTLALDLLVLGLLWLGYQVPALSWVAFAGMVWFEVEFALVSLMLWGMAGQYMTLGQGKRLFGIVGCGEPLAVVLGGLATVPLLRWLRPADLLLLSGLGVLVGMGLAAVLTRRFTAQRECAEDAGAGAPATPAPLWRSPYVRVLMTVLFFSQLGYFFVDAAFYERAHARFADEKALAAFLGMTSAAVGAVSLATGLFVSGPLVRHLGVRAGLLTLPALLLAGSLAVLACGHLGGPAELLFWLVVGNKLVDQALRYTLDKTSTIVLLQPLPAQRRNGVQAAMESVVEPLAGGVAGLCLIAMDRWLGFDALGITHAIAAAVAVWFALVFAQHRGYLEALRQALARRPVAPRTPAPPRRAWARVSRARGHAAVEDELQRLAWLLRCREDLRPLAAQGDIARLCAALAAEAAARLEDVLQLIARLHPQAGLEHAVHVLRTGSDAQRAYLAEAVDSRLPRPLRPRLAALLAHDAARGSSRFLQLSRLAPGQAAQRLAEIAGARAGHVSARLRRCAAQAHGALPGAGAAADPRPAAQHGPSMDAGAPLPLASPHRPPVPAFAHSLFTTGKKNST